MIHVRPGDRIAASVRGINSDAVVQFLVNITPKGRPPYTLDFTIADVDGDRTTTALNSDVGDISSQGVITSATARLQSGTASTQPGEEWVEMDLRRSGLVIATLAFGYLYGGHPVSYPNVDLPGPLDGRGRLVWVQVADDVAGGTATTQPLAVTNAFVRVREIVVVYHSDATVATRTVSIRIRDRGTSTKPTGFTITDNMWTDSTLTLTQNEEGVVHLAPDHFISFNDASTVTYGDRTTAPHPLPLDVEATDPVDLVVTVTNGQAGDDYDIWILREEWIVI